MALLGCGSSGEEQLQPQERDQERLLDAPEGKESIEEAVERIEAAVGSDDCKEVNELNLLSRPSLNTKQRCEYLQRLARFEVEGAEEYGDLGAVIDYELNGRIFAAILLREADGLYHVAYLDPFLDAASVGTKFDTKFDATADAAVRALREKDCEAFLKHASRRLGRGAGTEKDVCERVKENALANIYEASPAVEGPTRIGGNENYGFFTIATPSLYMTVVVARQTDSGLPGVPELPKGAPELGFVDAYLTNRKEPVE